MENLNFLLKIINLLSDGKLHTNKELKDVLNINQILMNDYTHLMRYWGINILNIPKIGFIIDKPLQLLDKSIINIYNSYNNRLMVLPVINSTNKFLIKNIDNLIAGDACIAEYQLQGYGKYGKEWISSFGRNICLSIYWKFKFDIITNTLSLMVAITIAEFLYKIGIEEIKIKWPNDIYLNNRKLAGILVEIINFSNSFLHVIIGIGINLFQNQSIYHFINKPWINLSKTNIDINRNFLIANLIYILRFALKKFEKKGFLPFFSSWQKLDYLYNKTILLMIENLKIEGIVCGINMQGALLLKRKGKIFSYIRGKILIHQT